MKKERQKTGTRIVLYCSENNSSEWRTRFGTNPETAFSFFNFQTKKRLQKTAKNCKSKKKKKEQVNSADIWHLPCRFSSLRVCSCRNESEIISKMPTLKSLLIVELDDINAVLEYKLEDLKK